MALERLQWLVWMCNLSGVLPFRMIVKDGQFHRFEFQWKHPLGVWFALVLLGQLGYVVVFITFCWRSHVYSKRSLPTVYTIAKVLLQSSAIVNLLSPMLLLLHPKKLQSAIESIRKFDEIMKDKIPTASCTTRLRTVLGLIITLVWVVTVAVANRESFEGAFAEHVGQVGSRYAAALCIVLDIQMGVWFLVVHLSYYNIAHRISLLARYINPSETALDSAVFRLFPLRAIKISVQPKRMSDEPAEKLATCGHLFHHLINASSAVNATFSLPFLFILLSATINSIINLYYMAYAWLVTSCCSISGQINSISNMVMVLALLVAPDMPVDQLETLREQILAVKPEVVYKSVLLLELDDERLRFSAGGLFNVGRQLIPTATATVITYLAILLQSTVKT